LSFEVNMAQNFLWQENSYVQIAQYHDLPQRVREITKHLIYIFISSYTHFTDPADRC
jgi:two-component SAPR family response regulator